MRKQRENYISRQNALVAVSKQLSMYKNQRNVDSGTFFDRYPKGLIDDEAESGSGLIPTSTTSHCINN
jgi:hypothetical protein